MADIKRGAPFLAIGFALLAIGLTGRRVFVTVGSVFLILALVRIVGRR